MSWNPARPTSTSRAPVTGWFAYLAVQSVGIPSAEAFGALTVIPNPQVHLTGIPSAEAIGALAAIYPQYLGPTSIPSAEAFGALNVQGPTQYLALASIPSAEAFGSLNAIQNVSLTGIPSPEAFGGLSALPGPVSVALTGIPSAEAFGSDSVSQNVALAGMGSAEAFGSMTVIPPSPPAVQIVGTPTTSTTSSVTLPAHQAGDLLLIFAYNPTVFTGPTPPTAGGAVPAWVMDDNPNGSDNNAIAIGHFVATANNHTSGVWSDTNGMIAVVIRNQRSSGPIGGHGTTTGTSTTTATAPAVTLADTSGSSLLFHCLGHRSTSGFSAWNAAPAGYTKIAEWVSSTGMCLLTKDSTTSDGSVTQNTNGGTVTQGYAGATVEIRQ